MILLPSPHTGLLRERCFERTVERVQFDQQLSINLPVCRHVPYHRLLQHRMASLPSARSGKQLPQRRPSLHRLEHTDRSATAILTCLHYKRLTPHGRMRVFQSSWLASHIGCAALQRSAQGETHQPFMRVCPSTLPPLAGGGAACTLTTCANTPRNTVTHPQAKLAKPSLRHLHQPSTASQVLLCENCMRVTVLKATGPPGKSVFGAGQGGAPWNRHLPLTAVKGVQGGIWHPMRTTTPSFTTGYTCAHGWRNGCHRRRNKLPLTRRVTQAQTLTQTRNPVIAMDTSGLVS